MMNLKFNVKYKYLIVSQFKCDYCFHNIVHEINQQITTRRVFIHIWWGQQEGLLRSNLFV